MITHFQGYEQQWTEEDIKFGFPTSRDKKKQQLSIDTIWNDELFDSEKYQDWEDAWAEFDISKVRFCTFLYVYKYFNFLE